jgi:hypothetical protein
MMAANWTFHGMERPSAGMIEAGKELQIEQKPISPKFRQVEQLF